MFEKFWMFWIHVKTFEYMRAISSFMPTPLHSQSAQRFFQKDDIDSLVVMLRNNSVKSFQSFKGTVFDTNRPSQVERADRFDKVFLRIQVFLEKLDEITNLINELVEMEKDIAQQHLWQHFISELRTAVPDIQTRLKRIIAASQDPPRQHLLEIWDGVLEEIKQRSHLAMNGKMFSPLTIPGPTKFHQQNQIYNKFLLFFDEIIGIAEAMIDEKLTELSVPIETPEYEC